MKNYSINNCKITLQPTEDKYSIMPMKVYGFMPSISGTTIMLPSDIITMSGTDFK